MAIIFVLLAATSVVLAATNQAHRTDDDSSSTNDSDPTSRHHSKPTSTVRGGLSPFQTTTTKHHHPSTSTSLDVGSFITPLNSPTGIPHRPPAHSTPPVERHSQSGWIIALEVVAGLVGLALLIALLRCFRSYRKTPRPQHTHQESIQEIRQELRAGRLARIFRMQPPPPPYEPAPDYESATSHHREPRTHSASESQFVVPSQRPPSISPPPTMPLHDSRNYSDHPSTSMQGYYGITPSPPR